VADRRAAIRCPLVGDPSRTETANPPRRTRSRGRLDAVASDARMASVGFLLSSVSLSPLTRERPRPGQSFVTTGSARRSEGGARNGSTPRSPLWSRRHRPVPIPTVAAVRTGHCSGPRRSRPAGSTGRGVGQGAPALRRGRPASLTSRPSRIIPSTCRSSRRNRETAWHTRSPVRHGRSTGTPARRTRQWGEIEARSTLLRREWPRTSDAEGLEKIPSFFSLVHPRGSQGDRERA
jgi:hypothetical protein